MTGRDTTGAGQVRTNHLVVIAGPPCAGKTTLVARIREGALPKLCEQLELGDPGNWVYVDATELGRMTHAFVDRLVVHYDLLVQRSPRGYKHLPGMFVRAGRIVFLTVQTGPETLRRRSRARLAAAISSLARKPVPLRGRVKRLRNLLRRHRVFRKPARVAHLYEEWFRFAAGYPEAPHWVIDPAASSVAATAVAEARDRRAARSAV